METDKPTDCYMCTVSTYDLQIKTFDEPGTTNCSTLYCDFTKFYFIIQLNMYKFVSFIIFIELHNDHSETEKETTLGSNSLSKASILSTTCEMMLCAYFVLPFNHKITAPSVPCCIPFFLFPCKQHPDAISKDCLLLSYSTASHG